MNFPIVHYLQNTKNCEIQVDSIMNHKMLHSHEEPMIFLNFIPTRRFALLNNVILL